MPAPALSAPNIALTVKPSAPNMAALLDHIGEISATMDQPDRVATTRLNETAFCAKLYVATRPVDPRSLH